MDCATSSSARDCVVFLRDSMADGAVSLGKCQVVIVLLMWNYEKQMAEYGEEGRRGLSHLCLVLQDWTNMMSLSSRYYCSQLWRLAHVVKIYEVLFVLFLCQWKLYCRG